MKKLLASSLLMASIALPLTSYAGADSGLYIGGSVGQSALDDGYDFDEKDTAYKLLVGYNFGLVPLVDLAVEADYRDFGTFEGEGSVDIVAFDVFGVAGMNFGPFGVFAKAGYSDSDIDFEGGSDSESNMGYGLGAKFQLASFALRAEYETFDMDDVDDLSMISVGATITF